MQPMHNSKLSQHADAHNSTVNGGSMESNEETPKPSPLKRPRIEIHVQPRSKAFWNKHYPVRTNAIQFKVQVKPANTTENDSSGMSHTSKRIFEVLEHFSTPISNVEDISLQRQKTWNGSSFATRTRLGGDAKSQSSRVGLRYLTRELCVPTVPEILKLTRLRRLQHTTMAAREIVSASNSPPPDLQTYRLGSEINKNSKYCGKIKTKSKTIIENRGTVQNVNLPDIALPLPSLSNNIMFELKFPEFKKSTEQTNYFKFSSPIKLTNPQQIIQWNYTFKFRPALNVENQPQMLNKSSSISPLSNFIWTDTPSSVTLKEKKSNEKESSIELKTGSVIDFFNKSNKKTTDQSNSAKNENNHKELNLEDTCNSNDNNNNYYNKTFQNSGTINPPVIESEEAKKICFTSQLKILDNHSDCTEDGQIDLGCESCDKMKTKVNKSKLESTLSILESSNSNIIGKSTPSYSKTGLHKSCSVNMTIGSSDGKNDTGEITVPISTPPLVTISSAQSKSNKTQWECPSCMIKYDDDADARCLCCKTLKPVDSIDESKKIELAPSKRLLEKFVKLQGSCSNDEPGTEESKSNEQHPRNETLPLGIPEQSTKKELFSFGIKNKNSSDSNFTNSTQQSWFVFGKNANTNSTGNVEFRGGAFNDPPSDSFNFNFNMPKPKQPKVATPEAIDTVFGIPRKVDLGNQATSSLTSTSAVNNAGFNFSSLPPPASRSFEVEPMEIVSSVPFSPNTGYIFNPNDKPSVNLTDGEVQTTLNVPPEQTQQRRIIKAVRRRRDGQR